MAKGRKTGGRKKGSVNKTTASVKAALTQAFQLHGGVPALLRWAKDNETEFYRLWSKLVPTEVNVGDGEGGTGLTIRVIHE